MSQKETFLQAACFTGTNHNKMATYSKKASEP